MTRVCSRTLSSGQTAVHKRAGKAIRLLAEMFGLITWWNPPYAQLRDPKHRSGMLHRCRVYQDQYNQLQLILYWKGKTHRVKLQTLKQNKHTAKIKTKMHRKEKNHLQFTSGSVKYTSIKKYVLVFCNLPSHISRLFHRFIIISHVTWKYIIQNDNMADNKANHG